jgi:hypothetical protein
MFELNDLNPANLAKEIIERATARADGKILGQMCSGTTNAGESCKRPATNGDFCWRHHPDYKSRSPEATGNWVRGPLLLQRWFPYTNDDSLEFAMFQISNDLDMNLESVDITFKLLVDYSGIKDNFDVWRQVAAKMKRRQERLDTVIQVIEEGLGGNVKG